MNVDLAHPVTDGVELIGLKIESNTPYDAALQVLRYGAVYMLYRLEPELEGRFKSNPVMRAKRVVLEVLAPHPYYSRGDDLCGTVPGACKGNSACECKCQCSGSVSNAVGQALGYCSLDPCFSRRVVLGFNRTPAVREKMCQLFCPKLVG